MVHADMEVKNTFLEVVESSNKEPWRLRGMHSGCRSAGTTPVLWPKAAFPEREPSNSLREHLLMSRAADRQSVPADADPQYVELSEPLKNQASSLGRSSPYLPGYPTALSPQAPMWPATPEWLPWPSTDMRQHFLSGPAMSEGIAFPPSVDESPFEVLWGALGEDKLDPPPMHDDAPLDEVRKLKAKRPPPRPQDSPLPPSVTREEPEGTSEDQEGLFGILDETAAQGSIGSIQIEALGNLAMIEQASTQVMLERPTRKGGKGRGAKGDVDGAGGPVQCRSWAAKGQCRFGQQCRFAHDMSSMVVPQKAGNAGGDTVVARSQPSNSKASGKGSGSVVLPPRQPSEVAVPSSQAKPGRRWTVIWCDEQAFKASGASMKQDLEDLGMVIKAYKTSANCIRSLNKKLLPVLPCCLVISSISNAAVLLPYLAERPALVRGVVVLAEEEREENNTLQEKWQATVKAVAPNWAQCLTVVKAIMEGR
eukprot:gnl/MRDRNA2_/MRDRNA2_161579_c0_seq1.p1 gnl/MRDRNA2_/MRDRNA2_161579_c0~~gnl/MRDRNA2_/MRDRNA2_161579_c0_seq1.p1  ORF type:complete len:562 (-),score=117.11 gnl/MRDRNA2_/MRDRNA2_161579_c0_seq1:50-1489(-)